MKEYVTAKEIVVPAGSKVWTGWEATPYIGSEHVDVLVGLHPDMCGRLVFDLKDAIETGTVKEAENVHVG